MRADRVSLINASAGRWLELDLEGRIVSMTALPQDRQQVTGAGVSDEGNLYVSFPAGGGEPTLARLDKLARAWVPLERRLTLGAPGAPATAESLSILGFDAGSLVLRSKPRNSIQWVRVE